MFATILVGTDGSESAAMAVERALSLASAFGGEVHIAIAYRPLTERQVADRQRGLPPHKQAEIDNAHDARLLLDRIKHEAAGRGVQVELHARVGDAGPVLVKLAEEVAADVVIVGSRGMTGLSRVLGSVPNHVSHHAPCSVMIEQTSGR